MQNTGVSQNITCQIGDTSISLQVAGQGRPILILHGGGGPLSVGALAKSLAGEAQVFTPIHPGFAMSEHPSQLSSVAALADLYLSLLRQLDLQDVIVIGCSMGGWIAAKMAVQDDTRMSRLILINSVGISVPGEVIADVFSLQPQELASLSYHDPSKAFLPAAASPEQRAVMASNLKALAIYGRSMFDPDLKEQLRTVDRPTLVVWGESDKIVSPTYGKALAEAFARGVFVTISECGHMPQLENLPALLNMIAPFIQEQD